MKIQIPGCPEQFVLVDNHGEHHMGCATFEYLFPFDVAGQCRFFATNGEIKASLDGISLLLRDSLLLLRINGVQRKVEHYQPPAGKFIYELIEEETAYRLRLHGRGGINTWIEVLKETPFLPGLGPAADGLMPSAYKPVVESILAARRQK